MKENDISRALSELRKEICILRRAPRGVVLNARCVPQLFCDG
jgi:hypothetical protein